MPKIDVCIYLALKFNINGGNLPNLTIIMLDKNIKFIGFGCPLMDMIAEVSTSTIKKYNLKLNETTHQKMSETNIFSVLETETSTTYVPGGCSFNTMRVLNVKLY